ncbi:MAG: phosphoribosyltransferase family protein [Dongiaceae bacterium]
MRRRLFADRSDAGRRLAARLGHLAGPDTVVLALPRGGVPVAAEVARALGAPLDLVLVRKIGMPFQPELALGAIAEGDPPQLFIDETLRRTFAVSESYLERAIARERAEIERRRRLYGEGRRPAAIAGRTAIVVDDGIATGATTRVALEAVRGGRPARLVLAVPVAPRDSLEALAGAADEIVCLETPEPFGAIGQFYEDFDQLADDAVVALLRGAAQADAERQRARPTAG